MEAFLEKIESHEYSAIEKSTFNNQFSQFEAPLLLKYASDINNLKYENDEDFISVLCECINKIDGKKDIYMGVSKDLAFRNNLNIILTINKVPPPKVYHFLIHIIPDLEKVLL